MDPTNRPSCLCCRNILTLMKLSLLLVFLHYPRHLRGFCGFEKVPDASKITRFKQDFLVDLQNVFEEFVDLTEPICQAVDLSKAGMTIFDSSGIEAWVAENNPKYADRIIKQLKAYAKAHNYDKNHAPYKAAYRSMPSHAAADPEIEQMYIDGHFCYAFKIGIVTNGLGIIRHLEFYDQDFFAAYPEIKIEKRSDHPDEDKSVHDARLLVPTLQDFFRAHPLISPESFLGDAAFDSVKIYKDLLSGDTFGTDPAGNGLHFKKAFIPLDSRAKLESKDYTLDDNGIPYCPHDPSLSMKPEGTSKLRSGVVRYKSSCPRIKWVKIPGPKNTSDSASVKTPVRIPPANGWSIPIRRKNCALILARCAEHLNGRPHIRCRRP